MNGPLKSVVRVVEEASEQKSANFNQIPGSKATVMVKTQLQKLAILINAQVRLTNLLMRIKYSIGNNIICKIIVAEN